MNAKEQAKQDAIKRLLEILKPGDTVYTVLRKISSSGMSRRIDVYAIWDSEHIFLTGLVAKACGMSRPDKGEGLRIGGCGMDMGFAIVHELSYTLFPNGFTCIGEKCPSNDHFNGDRNYEPHQHKSGGYALKHRWI